MHIPIIILPDTDKGFYMKGMLEHHVEKLFRIWREKV